MLLDAILQEHQYIRHMEKTATMNLRFKYCIIFNLTNLPFRDSTTKSRAPSKAARCPFRFVYNGIRCRFNRPVSFLHGCIARTDHNISTSDFIRRYILQGDSFLGIVGICTAECTIFPMAPRWRTSLLTSSMRQLGRSLIVPTPATWASKNKVWKKSGAGAAFQVLTPAPFFYYPFQAFSQNAQPSRNAGMIFGDWGFAPTSKIRSGATWTLLANFWIPKNTLETLCW